MLPPLGISSFRKINECSFLKNVNHRALAAGHINEQQARLPKCYGDLTIVSTLSTVACTCSVGLPALDAPGSTRQQSKKKTLTIMHRARRMAFSVAFIITALILLAAELMSLPSLGPPFRVRHLFFSVLLIIAVPFRLSKHKPHGRPVGQLLETATHRRQGVRLS
jgi:hypothetical protein